MKVRAEKNELMSEIALKGALLERLMKEREAEEAVSQAMNRKPVPMPEGEAVAP